MQYSNSSLDPGLVTISVVFRDPLLRMGVFAALRSDPRFSVRVDWESSAMPVDRRLDESMSGVDVVVADYEAGLTIAECARMRPALPRAMIVTYRDRESEIRHALEGGVLGYVLTGCNLEEIRDGVLRVHQGHRHLGHAAAQRIADGLVYQKLTAREEDVLRLVAAGCSNKVVARQLSIAVGTVKAHVRSIFDKLGSTSRTQAAAEAQRRGLMLEEVDDQMDSVSGRDRAARQAQPRLVSHRRPRGLDLAP